VDTLHSSAPLQVRPGTL